MTNQLKGLIVNLHNSLRNDIATGAVEGYETAKRMGTMVSGSVGLSGGIDEDVLVFLGME